jgi:hypothetical protein
MGNNLRPPKNPVKRTCDLQLMEELHELQQQAGSLFKDLPTVGVGVTLGTIPWGYTNCILASDSRTHLKLE